jgi:hypothetical protein
MSIAQADDGFAPAGYTSLHKFVVGSGETYTKVNEKEITSKSLSLTAESNMSIPLTITNYSAYQTANLVNFKNGAGLIRAYVGPDGEFQANGYGTVTATGPIKTTDTTASTTTTTGSGRFAGGVGVAGQVTAGGALKTTDTTASTTTTTGSGLFGGGVGVAGQVTAGGALKTTDTTASTTTTTGSGLFGGGVGVGGALNVYGAATSNNGLEIPNQQTSLAQTLGFTGPSTKDIPYNLVKTGRRVMLQLDAATDTSTGAAVATSATAIAATYRPLAQVISPICVYDNGATILGYILIATDGTISIGCINPTTNATTTFTGSGTWGIHDSQVVEYLSAS